MKNLLYIFAAIFALTSCDTVKFEDDINVNPNVPTEASPSQLLTSAMKSLPDLSSTPEGEFMAQYLAETIYVGASLYPEGSTSFYGLYEGPLMDLETIINADELGGPEDASQNELAVSKILKAYFTWHAADRWGDLPYSEALQGKNNFTPAYDTQKAIYDSLFVLLEEANNQIEVDGTVDGDLIYDGNMMKWKRLANTIHLLMALRLSEVDPQRGRQEFNEALNEGIMTSNDDNFAYRHLPNANNQNYWYGQIQIQGREWWALTESLVSLMKPVDDPRLPVYGNEARDGGGYIGLTFGETDDIGTERFSLLGDAIWAQDAPVYLVTYAEALFAKAEASERGWISESAETNYNLAVETSIEQWTGDESTAADFLVQPEVAYDSGNAIEQIATQRYVHLFMHGYQAWAEWRRTGYPDNLVEPRGKAVPRRQSYPDDETFNNTENYQEAIDRQFDGEDTLYGRIWWDVE